MSLESWKQAYYPVDADAVDSQDAVAHSLRKWEGLRPDALAEHELEFFSGGIRDEVGRYLGIHSGTCALCECHFDDIKSRDDDTPPEEHVCGTCPLYLARGGVPCDVNRTDEMSSPFHYWQQSASPGPMIHWLKKAQEYEAAQAKPTIKVRVHEGPKPDWPFPTSLGERLADELNATDPGDVEEARPIDHAAWDALRSGITSITSGAQRTSHAPLGGLHHEGPAKPPVREGD